MVEFLPSKQAVAGSSPVSRSLHRTVSLQALLRPIGDNQAMKGYDEDGFVFGKKAFKEILPTNPCKILPHHTRESLSRSS